MTTTSGEEADLQDRLFVDIFNRFVKLVLFARLGNGTWHKDDLLTSFHIEFSDDDDQQTRIRINDEQAVWSHPRAARALDPETMIEPADIVVERLPLPQRSMERFIRGTLTADGWMLELRLNRPHPRRDEHLSAAREFVEAATHALAKDQIRVFYESAFHAAEHLAQAELLSYAPTIELVSSAKTHQTVRSTYALWARLGDTDERFPRLLTSLEESRQATTYLRYPNPVKQPDAEEQLAVLHEMLEWVAGVVEGGDGRKVVKLLANREIAAGELVGTDDLRLRP